MNQPMTLIHPLKTGLALLLLQGTTHAAVTLFAEYHLGEASSLSATTLIPQDSSGNGRHLTNAISGSSAAVGTTSPFAPGSTAYLSTAGTGDEGWYGSNVLTSLPTDNFAIGVYASAAGNATQGGDVIALGGGNQAFKLSLDSTGWIASSHNVDYIGSAATFTADQWVHLALIRNNGITTFYVNGVAQGATYAGDPVHDTVHISVNPGGLTYFDGLIDEARIATFTSGESTANILGTLQGVPEPSTALLGGLGALILLRRRR